MEFIISNDSYRAFSGIKISSSFFLTSLQSWLWRWNRWMGNDRHSFHSPTNIWWQSSSTQQRKRPAARGLVDTGAENRPSGNDPAGRLYQESADPPQGTLISPCFRIVCKNISFLIGGGCTIKDIRAELIVDNQVRLFTLTIIFPLIFLKQPG